VTPAGQKGFRRGFINPDSRMDITDSVVSLGYLFQ
jgi:hypothetical protein